MTKIKKHPGGRPTLYNRKFHNEDFIRLSKQGKTISQIALEWDVNRSSIYEWADKHQEFSITLKKGKEFAEAWYANLGQLAMMGQAQINGQKIKVDVGLYVWLTKNLFKWNDKIELSPATEEKRPYKDLSDEELDAIEIKKNAQIEYKEKDKEEEN